MRFIYKHGYTCFMGRMFAFKKSVEVTDKATIAALLKRKDFMRVDDEPFVMAETAQTQMYNSEVNKLTNWEKPKRPTLSLRKAR